MVLEPTDRPGTRLLVACTHLYFHPLGSVIRLLQAAVAARLLSWLSSTHSSSGGEVLLYSPIVAIVSMIPH